MGRGGRREGVAVFLLEKKGNQRFKRGRNGFSFCLIEGGGGFLKRSKKKRALLFLHFSCWKGR